MKTRPKSHLPLCVACFYRIGWGIRRIMRHTGYPKTSVHRFARAHGLIDPTTAQRKKDAFNKRKAEFAAEREARRQQQIAARKSERANKPKLTAMDRYYANVEKSRADARRVGRRLYAREKAHRQTTGEVHTRTIARRLRHRIWFTVARDNGTKSAKTEALVGCSFEQLRAHLASKFEVGMTWANYGSWEIDHIKPCASFNLSDPEQQRACFHYSNLQPLWRADNRRKWARVAA